MSRGGGGIRRLNLAAPQIQAGAGDATWGVWHCMCLIGFPSSFSLPAPRKQCVRQFILAIEVGRQRAETGGSGAEAVWVGGGMSACSSACDMRLVSPEWESCEQGEI